MGYDQWFSFNLFKVVAESEKEKFEAQARSFLSTLDDESIDTEYDTNSKKLWVSMSYGTKHIDVEPNWSYDGTDLRDVSSKLGCSISIEYTGEDKEDWFELLIENGRVTSHVVPAAVDLVKKADWTKKIREVLLPIRSRDSATADAIQAAFDELLTRVLVETS